MIQRLHTPMSARPWALASLAMGFLVALCIAIAPKPTCTRTANEVPALVEKTRDSTTRQRVIEDQLDDFKTSCMDRADHGLDNLLAARALATDARTLARIDDDLARAGPLAARAYLACRDYGPAARAVRIARAAGASEDVLFELESRLGLREIYR